MHVRPNEEFVNMIYKTLNELIGGSKNSYNYEGDENKETSDKIDTSQSEGLTDVNLVKLLLMKEKKRKIRKQKDKKCGEKKDEYEKGTYETMNQILRKDEELMEENKMDKTVMDKENVMEEEKNKKYICENLF